MDAKELAILCAKIADSKKATDIAVLEMSRVSELTDYFVICNGESERQVQSIAYEIELALRERQCKYSGMEGYTEGKWILMDYIEVVVHIYLSELRTYYEIDDLWADAPRFQWENSPISVESSHEI